MFSDRKYNQPGYPRSIRGCARADVWILIGHQYRLLSDFSARLRLRGESLRRHEKCHADAPYNCGAVDRPGTIIMAVIHLYVLHGEISPIFCSICLGLYCGTLVARFSGVPDSCCSIYQRSGRGRHLDAGQLEQRNSPGRPSGALFGVMLAVAMLRPRQPFLFLFLPCRFRAKRWSSCIRARNHQRTPASGQCRALAHLGGILGAFLFLTFFCRRDVSGGRLTGSRGGFAAAALSTAAAFGGGQKPPSSQGGEEPVSSRGQRLLGQTLPGRCQFLTQAEHDHWKVPAADAQPRSLIAWAGSAGTLKSAGTFRGNKNFRDHCVFEYRFVYYVCRRS